MIHVAFFLALLACILAYMLVFWACRMSLRVDELEEELRRHMPTTKDKIQ